MTSLWMGPDTIDLFYRNYPTFKLLDYWLRRNVAMCLNLRNVDPIQTGNFLGRKYQAYLRWDLQKAGVFRIFEPANIDQSKALNLHRNMDVTQILGEANIPQAVHSWFKPDETISGSFKDHWITNTSMISDILCFDLNGCWNHFERSVQINKFSVCIVY